MEELGEEKRKKNFGIIIKSFFNSLFWIYRFPHFFKRFLWDTTYLIDIFRKIFSLTSLRLLALENYVISGNWSVIDYWSEWSFDSCTNGEWCATQDSEKKKTECDRLLQWMKLWFVYKWKMMCDTRFREKKKNVKIQRCGIFPYVWLTK